jgi:excisionase family DNA binding protein
MKTKINELCRAAGIATAYQLQKKIDLSPSQAARLYKDAVEAISLSVLEKLCDTLKCSPNDIFGVEVVKVEAQKPVRELVTRTAKATGSDLLTTIEVAERLGLSRKRVNDYVTSGELRSVKGKGNHNFISEADLQAFIDNRKGN